MKTFHKNVLIFSVCLLATILFFGTDVEADDSTVTILTLGDSVTYGYPYGGTDKTYPARLGGTLQETTDYYTYSVVNRGVNGYKADQVLDSIQNDGWLDVDPDFVLLMVGGNDLAQETNPDLSNLTEVLDQTTAEVQSIVDEIKGHTNADGSTPQVILSAFIPNNSYGVGGSLYVAAYNERLKDNITSTDIWFTTNWDDLYDSDIGQADTSLMSDPVHPNDEGYAIIADNWYQAIDPLLPEDPDVQSDDGDSDGDDGDGNDDGDDSSNNNNDSSDDDGTNTSTANLDPKILTTSGPGETTRLQACDRHGNPTGSELSDLFPSSYTGGAGIIPVDQSNNGIKDQFVIFATSNGGPQARVMGLDSSGNLDIKGQMFVFDSSIRDGLSMTSGDFDNDGYEDDLAACLTGNKEPQVRIYTDITGADNWTLINQFTANFPEVGCNLGTFQYDGNATELLVTPHHGPSTPKVYIYTVGGTLKNSFLAYETSIDQGVTASGIGERIYTTPNNGSSHIISYDKHGNKKSFWWAYQDHVRGDFKNIPGDIDLDGKDEILISPTGSNGPHVLSFETTNKARTWPNFFAFDDPTLRNGVGIAVIDNWEGEN